MASKGHKGADDGKGVRKASDTISVFEIVCFKHAPNKRAASRLGSAGLPEVIEVSEIRAISVE
jgi:hypothetical protein